MTPMPEKAAISDPRMESAASDDDFVRAFNEMRSELVDALYYVLGSYDDAKDAAQDTLLICLRSRDMLEGVRNIRAWIFRVGLNAAKNRLGGARPLASTPA